ncbi:hypothetical protein CTI12_AA186430 [Artemisia annua]|uniref:Uncharacterized protein n=1 Tax=Artemisia annua TaxID=35608 RepID=A0A2U1P732_ARTAN|nr:hypothetical protein CTI12_AA186430 [Artemisia annua]
MTQASRVLKLDQLATKDFMSNKLASSHFSPIDEGEFIPLPPLVHDLPASPPYTIWPPAKSGQGVMSHDDKVNEPTSSQEGGFIPLPPLVHDQPASPPYTIWLPPKSGQGVMSHDHKVNEPASSKEGGFIPLPPLVHDQPAPLPYTMWPPPKSSQGQPKLI